MATVNRHAATLAWTTQSVSLGAGAGGKATLYVAFGFVSANGNNCHLDLVHIKANPTLTMGSGSVSCNYPYTTYYMAGRTEILYTVAQLTAAGVLPGIITSIGFNASSYSSQIMQSFNINMINSTQATLSGWLTGLQNCYTGSYAVPGLGWQMITLQNPFVWNGQNLLFEVCFGNNGSFTNYSTVSGTTAPSGQIQTFWNDNITGCSYTGATYSGNTGLPNLGIVELPFVGIFTREQFRKGFQIWTFAGSYNAIKFTLA